LAKFINDVVGTRQIPILDKLEFGEPKGKQHNFERSTEKIDVQKKMRHHFRRPHAMF
jgi:hypothetical protein